MVVLVLYIYINSEPNTWYANILLKFMDLPSNASNMQPEILSTSNDDNNDHIKKI